MGKREGDDLAGGLVVGPVDAAAVAGLGSLLGPPIAAPAARPALSGLRSAPGCSGLASLLVLEVQVALGPHRPPRHQQPGVLGHDRVRVDDAKVHPGDLIGVRVVLLNGHRGGDCEPQPACVVEQGHRPDLVGRVGQRAGQPHPQFGMALGDGQPDPPISSKEEGAVVEPDRDQEAFAAREPGPLPTVVPAGGLEPGIGVPLQYRAGPDHRQLPEAASAGELAAEGLIADHGRVALLASIAVAVQEPGPHVAGRPEQPVAAVGLGGGGPQADAGGAVHHLRSGGADDHLELMFAHACGPVKTGRRLCGGASLNRPRSGQLNQPGQTLLTAALARALADQRDRRPGTTGPAG